MFKRVFGVICILLLLVGCSPSPVWSSAEANKASVVILQTIGLEENEVISVPAVMTSFYDINLNEDTTLCNLPSLFERYSHYRKVISDSKMTFHISSLNSLKFWWLGGAFETTNLLEAPFICADGTIKNTSYLHGEKLAGTIHEDNHYTYAEIHINHGIFFIIIPKTTDIDIYTVIPQKPLLIPNQNFEVMIPVFNAETKKSSYQIADMLDCSTTLLAPLSVKAAFTLDKNGINVNKASKTTAYLSSSDIHPTLILNRPFYYGVMYSDGLLAYWGRYDYPTS